MNCLTSLYALPPEEWPARLRRLVSDAVSLILRRTIDPDHPLSEYGLDSMGNLELRTRIEAETGIRVTTNDITTIAGLAGAPVRKAGIRKSASTVAIGRTSKSAEHQRGLEEGRVFVGAGSARGLFVGTVYDWAPEPGQNRVLAAIARLAGESPASSDK